MIDKKSRKRKEVAKGKSAFTIAREVVNEVLLTYPSFTYAWLGERIVKAGGVMYVEVGLTVADYLKHKEKAGAIKYIPKKDRYYVLGWPTTGVNRYFKKMLGISFLQAVAREFILKKDIVGMMDVKPGMCSCLADIKQGIRIKEGAKIKIADPRRLSVVPSEIPKKVIFVVLESLVMVGELEISMAELLDAIK